MIPASRHSREPGATECLPVCPSVSMKHAWRFVWPPNEERKAHENIHGSSSSHRPRNETHVRSFLHRFLAFPRYMQYRRRGKILSHFSFPSLFSAAAAFVRFCDLAVRRRMINDISLSTAGCCRRRSRLRCGAMQLPPPPFRDGENRIRDSRSWS